MMKYIFLALFLVGCSNEPLLSIDASENTLSVGDYKKIQPINFRTRE